MHVENGAPSLVSLSRREYHHSRRTAHWKRRADSRMKEAREPSTTSSLRTADIDKFKEAVVERQEGWDVVWASRLRKVWRRDRLSSYMLQQKTLQGFWGKLRAGIERCFPGRTVAVAYGAADFDSSRKGDWAAAPTTSMMKAACVAFGRENVHPIDEYCTSTMSSCCAVKTDIVVCTRVVDRGRGLRETRRAGRTRARKSRRRRRVVPDAVAAESDEDEEWEEEEEEKEKREREEEEEEEEEPKEQAGGVRRIVRGRRRCSTCRRIWDRDHNACLNIGECFMQLCLHGSASPECRPAFLSRCVYYPLPVYTGVIKICLYVAGSLRVSRGARGVINQGPCAEYEVCGCCVSHVFLMAKGRSSRTLVCLSVRLVTCAFVAWLAACASLCSWAASTKRQPSLPRLLIFSAIPSAHRPQFESHGAFGSFV